MKKIAPLVVLYTIITLLASINVLSQSSKGWEWVGRLGIPLNRVYSPDGNKVIVFGNSGSIYQTDNFNFTTQNGQWTNGYITTTATNKRVLQSTVNFLISKFVDANTGYAYGYNTATLMTKNGINTDVPSPDPTTNHYPYHRVSQGIFKTTDGGKTWFLPYTPGSDGSLEKPTIYASTPTPTCTTGVHLPFHERAWSTSLEVKDMSFCDAQNGFAVMNETEVKGKDQNGNVVIIRPTRFYLMRTTDGGEHWCTVLRSDNHQQPMYSFVYALQCTSSNVCSFVSVDQAHTIRYCSYNVSTAQLTVIGNTNDLVSKKIFEEIIAAKIVRDMNNNIVVEILHNRNQFFLWSPANSKKFEKVFPDNMDVLPSVNPLLFDFTHYINSSNLCIEAVGEYGTLYRLKVGWDSQTSEYVQAENPSIIDLPTRQHLYGIMRTSASQYFIVGDFGTMVASNNGTDWNVVSKNNSDEIPSEKANFFDVSYNQTNGTHFGLACGSNGNLYRSTDDGVKWVKMNHINAAGHSRLNAVKVLNANEAIVVSSKGQIYKTTDRGDTWRIVYVMRKEITIGSVSKNVLVELRDVEYDNIHNKLIVVGDRKTILLSSDKGETWALQSAPGGLCCETFMSVKPSLHNTANSQIWIIVGKHGYNRYPNDPQTYSPKVLYSVDGGINWSTSASVPFDLIQSEGKYYDLYKVDYLSACSSFVMVGNRLYGVIAGSPDREFMVSPNKNMGIVMFASINLSNNNMTLSAGTNPQDITITNPTNSDFGRSMMFPLMGLACNGNQCFAVGVGGTIVRSPVYANSTTLTTADWDVLSSRTDFPLYGVAFGNSNSNVLTAVGAFGAILRSEQNGNYSSKYIQSEDGLEQSQLSFQTNNIDLQSNPNPAESNVSFKVKCTVECTLDIKIINQLGQELYSKRMFANPRDDNSFSLDVQNIASGVYHVVVYSVEDISSFSKSFVVKH